MKQIQIPFKPSMVVAIIEGNKICTSRNKKYGNEGDYFFIDSKQYRLTWISKQKLSIVANGYYKEEGFNSPEEFVAMWKEIHPVLGYTPNKLVWTHFFEAV